MDVCILSEKKNTKINHENCTIIIALFIDIRVKKHQWRRGGGLYSSKISYFSKFCAISSSFYRFCNLWYLRAIPFDILRGGGMEKMQLDVGVSPPATIMTFRPGLTHLSFDLDPCDL